MLIENPENVGIAPAALKAVRTGIGAALQVLYSDMLREELADRIAELVQQLDQRLKQLDQQKDTDGTERP
jgi:hypothetical protein